MVRQLDTKISDYSIASDVKHLLDRIGEDVYKKAKNDANVFREKLKGDLSEATYPNDERSRKSTPSKSCDLHYNFHTNVTSNVIEPCKHKSEKRFSDTQGAECDYRKIKCKKDSDNECGACAPFRRLHVCDKNLEQIDPAKITTHNLLVDVCQAAKFEGESISGYYQQYQATYGDVGSTMCTMLARSFADIGDIVRGRDLFLGYNETDRKEKKQLQQNLKNIFAKIYNEVTSTNGKTLQERYNDTENYFQLREDWWNANRETVWDAITCEAQGFNYFRNTCAGEKLTEGYCRCDDKTSGGKAGNGDVTIVPTYFDYVPQFLRWFEEWAEDFCRLRKHKLQNAIKNCRGDSGKEKYCDLNGYNCEETARGAEIFVKGKDCHKCSVACDRFVKWIDNQKKEFEKQEKKYTKEIKKDHGTTLQVGKTTINNLYVDYFYKILEKHYPTVDKFLEKLSKEKICEKQPEVEGKGKSIDFNDQPDNIFSRTKYCQACPLCGVEGKKGNWTDKEESKCVKVKQKKTYHGGNTTDIPVLTPEKGKTDVLKKYKKFCENSEKNSQINKDVWQCHYDDKDTTDVNDDSDNCILGKWDTFTQDKKVMSYNAFFWKWVHDMLIDSIKWKTELNSCINDVKTGKCKKRCHGNCKCYAKWVKQKETEWNAIKDHFGKQKDMIEKGMRPEEILEFLLEKDELLEIIQDTYGNANEIKRIEALLQQAGVVGGAIAGGENNTTIDKLLKHEGDEAGECLKTHKDNDCKQQQEDKGGPGRSAPSSPGSPQQPDQSDHDNADTGIHDNPDDNDAVADDDDDDEDESEDLDEQVDDGEGGGPKEAEEGKDVPEEAAEPVEEETHKGGSDKGDTGPKVEVEKVKPCEIVQKLFTSDDTTLQEACKQKYEKGREKFPNWKCIPSGDQKATSDKGSDATTERVRVARSAPETAPSSGTNQGSICVPPRRRRLYIQKLHDWASGNTQAGNTQGGGGEAQALSVQTTPATASGSHRDPLLAAFVESAAVETFFLWDRYKKLNTKKPQGDGSLLQTIIDGTPPTDDEEDPKPEEELKSGTIPNDFLRQMFYTLGDYKDIFEGKNMEVVNLLKDGSPGDKEMKEKEGNIKTAIEKHFSNSGSSSAPRGPQTQPNSDNDSKTWWSRNAPSIWKGMVCALTHKTENPQEVDENLKTKLFNKNGATNESIPKYKYETVTLENSETEARTNDDITTPTLTQFVKRPPYFRYLEEWGETFCKERKKRLKQIYKDCKVGQGRRKNGGKVCSGYGEHCDDQLENEPTIFRSLLCRECGKSCRFYKKWIGRKKEEFTKQEKIYNEQKKFAEGNNGGNEFSKTLKSRPEAKDFLKTLGPCSKNNSGEANIDFGDKDKTFGPADNCKPCPEFIINCQNGNCGANGNNCKDNKITAEKIGNGGRSTQKLDMRVSDDSKSGSGFDGLDDVCKDANIFEGIRKDVWSCEKVCGYVVCKSEKGNSQNVKEKQNDEKHIITIKALLHRWVEYFLEDYNKIKKKLNPCINDKGSTCQNKCDKKCNCVVQWIEKKRDEWKKIKDRFNEQYNGDDTEMKSSVKNILEELQPQTDVNKAIKPCGGLKAFEDSIHCNGSASSEKKGDTPKDIVECLLHKLETKATSCQKLPIDNQTEEQCKEPPPEDDYEDENEKKVEQPGFCPTVEEQTETVDEDACKAVDPNTVPDDNKDKKNEEDKVEESAKESTEESVEPRENSDSSDPKSKEEKPAQADIEPPAQPTNPPTVFDNPHLKTALMSSTIMWSIGIGFATFTYFYLKVLYIYIYIYVDVYVFCVYVFVWIYIYGFTCMCFIYILYICIYIEKDKNEKKKKKNLLK